MREARRKAETKQRTANPELSRPPDKPNPSKTPWWLLGNQNTGEVPSEALNIAFRLKPEGQNGEVLAKQPETETKGDRGDGSNQKGRGNDPLQHRRASKKDLTHI
ncbi:hypothetical protein F2Q68_00006558 [Brassica cretica]|uniref:Uncharacterized protein n=1 Tax=Brassica cretica TaxID=69181 RepID=A0A8S9JGK3_BRACR|nr:hypothetical protein F2Q68_00006558 [Brassica cretica]